MLLGGQVKRWFIIERCNDLGGWEQVPDTYSYDGEKKAERVMKSLNSRYVLRTRRASKSHEPNPEPDQD